MIRLAAPFKESRGGSSVSHHAAGLCWRADSCCLRLLWFPIIWLVMQAREALIGKAPQPGPSNAQPHPEGMEAHSPVFVFFLVPDEAGKAQAPRQGEKTSSGKKNGISALVEGLPPCDFPERTPGGVETQNTG